MYNVAVDVGGTFTDVLVFDEETGGLTEGKVLSTPEDPSKGVVEGIEAVCEKVGITFPDLHLFFHGTTVVTNMILTNTGSRVGLLTTKGHEQILHLARAWTPGPLYGWMALQKPDPPADPTDTVGISERMSSAGEVLEDLDENEVREAVKRLVDRGVESPRTSGVPATSFAKTILNSPSPSRPISGRSTASTRGRSRRSSIPPYSLARCCT